MIELTSELNFCRYNAGALFLQARCVSREIMMTEGRKENIKAAGLQLLIQIPLMAGLFYGCQYFNLPLGLTGAIIMVIFFAITILAHHKKFQLHHKVVFIGLLISSTLLAILFAYDYFDESFRVSQLHVIALISPPILIGNYLKKKNERLNDNK